MSTGNIKCKFVLDRCATRFEPEDLPSMLDEHECSEPITKQFSAPESMTFRSMGEAASIADLQQFLFGYLGDKLFAERFAQCVEIIRTKNADYSQGEQKGDRIAAFRRIARDVNISMEQAWAVFTQKHWGAVMKYVKDGVVESESIHGRINDIINYMVILGAIIADKDGEPG